MWIVAACRELCYCRISHYYVCILPQNIWILFAENNFSPSALVAVLHHFVHVGQHQRANAQQRVYALHAAGLYFLLLEIPGEPRDVPLYGWIKHRPGKISFLPFMRIPGGTSGSFWTGSFVKTEVFLQNNQQLQFSSRLIHSIILGYSRLTHFAVVQ